MTIEELASEFFFNVGRPVEVRSGATGALWCYEQTHIPRADSVLHLDLSEHRWWEHLPSDVLRPVIAKMATHPEIFERGRHA